MGYYDTRIRRDEPRSRVTRRSAQSVWTGSQTRSRSSAYNGTTYARRGHRRGNIVVPLGLVFAVFLTISLFLLGTLIAQNFQSAKAQSSPTTEEPAQAAIAEVSAGVSADTRPPVVRGLAKKTTILLLGSDQRPEDRSFRTDVILLLVLDAEQMRVSAISFPRDLWVEVPSLYAMKINQVQGLGGFEATAEMFEANFGVRPDYYMMTNFKGFTKFIDNRGGIDVEVAQELTDSCDLPQARDGQCTVAPGKVHMDGLTALWYVRSRATSSDYDRLRRAQEVVLAVGQKLVKFKTIRQYTRLKKEVEDNIETNLSPQNAVTMLPFAAWLLESPDRMQRYVINEEQATPTFAYNGMWILLPDPEAVRAVLREAGAIP